MADPIDELLDRAVAALNGGEVARAHTLADEVLEVDSANADATDLLSADAAPRGELRRLTVMFCDLVGSTEMSEHLEPETYRLVVSRFQRACRDVIEGRYEGSIVSLKGDGMLASFGFPTAHENDAERAIRAGFEIIASAQTLAEQVAREHGEEIAVRLAVHKGIVFVDLEERDLYGFAVNVAARLEALAEPGTVLISEAVKRVIGDRFELHSHEPRVVKGVASPVVSYTVVGENAPGSSRSSAPIVGRSAELARLDEAWQRTKRDERSAGECVTLVGDSGIGKSRLARSLAEAVEKDGLPVVEVFGSPLETDAGLGPLRRFVDRRCGMANDAEPVARLARLRATAAEVGLDESHVALLATLLGIPASAGYEPVASDARRLRDEIDAAVVAFLTASFPRAAGLALFEDAHWFDEQTRAIVGEATRQLPPGVLTVVTSRTAAAVPRGSSVTAIELSALSDDAALELVRTLNRDDASDAELAELARRGDGVPLYLEELVRARTTEPTDASPLLPPKDARVPDVLYEPLMARLNVSPEAVAVSAAAAALGQPAGRDLLGTIAGLHPSLLDDAVDALLDGHVLVRVDGGDDLSFRHELLREAAYELQPPTRRRELHARAADVLVDSTHDDAIDWARVADHLALAERVGDAADAYERAAQQARTRGALVEARALLSKAVAMADADPAGRPERRAQLRLGRAYLAQSLEGNQSTEAAADYEYCLDLLVDRPPGDELLAALLALSAYYMARAEFDRADALIDAIAKSAEEPPPVVEALLAGCDGLIGFYRGDAHRAAAGFARQRALLEKTGIEIDISNIWFIPLDPMVIAKTSDIYPRIMAGDFKNALPLMAEARGYAEAVPFPRGPFTLCAFLGFESWFHVVGGDFDTALRVVDEMAELSERHGFDTWAMMAATEKTVFSGLDMLLRGEVAENTAHFSMLGATLGSYMAMWKAVGQYLLMPFYLTTQAQFHAAAGELAQARAAIDEARAVAARTGQFIYEPETIRYGARLCETPDDQAEGFREAYARAIEQGLPLFQLNAAIDLALVGNVTPLEETLPLFDGRADFPTLTFARDVLSRARER